MGIEVLFCDRVCIVKEVGFDGIGLCVENYIDVKNVGVIDEEMIVIFNEYDMKVIEVEYII